MKKTLAFGIVLLFIGVAFAPSLYADVETISEQQELVKYTIEFYGFDTLKTNTVFLDYKEAEQIDTIFENFKNKIKNTTQIDEFESIYNTTLSELYDIGLINSNDLIESKNLINNLIKINLAKNSKEQKALSNDLSLNYLVFIALRADYANFMPPIVAISTYIILNYDYFKENLPFVTFIFDTFLGSLLSIIEIILTLMGGVTYLSALGLALIYILWIYFGNIFPIGYSVSLSYSNQKNYGWVYAAGLKGIQVLEGEYQGALAGFTGLRIFKDSDFFMFGFSLASVLGK